MKLNDISQEEFENIEAYLNNQLSEEELENFNKHLENDKDLRVKIQEIKTLISGVELMGLKNQLNRHHNEIIEDNTAVNRKIRNNQNPGLKYFAIAATILIFLTGYWFINQNSNQRLYNNYFMPDPGLPTTMSTSNNYEFYKTMVTYKTGNYKKAIEEWKIQLSKQPENDTLNYFIGVAHMANKNEKDAIAYLKKVNHLQANTFKSDANFYLGLAYLKLNKKEEAKTVLKLSDLPESEELLKKIE
jgi:tetratricopeptide (TPR) repeat protein